MSVLRVLFVVVLFLFANTALPVTVEEPPELLRAVPAAYHDGVLITTSFYGIAMDGDGNIFAVTPSNGVLKYDRDENFIDVIGLGTGTADGQFRLPENLAIDSAGNIYVSDMLSRLYLCKDNQTIRDINGWQCLVSGAGSGKI